MHKTGTHSPHGVLHHLVMELVVLFWSTEDMQHATHRAIKATVLQDKATAVRAMAPLEIHIKVYVRAVGRDPSKLQSPPSEKEENPIHPLTIPTPVGKPCSISKCSLEILLTMNCISSWRISAKRLHTMNWMHPPEVLHQCLGDTHQGVGILMKMTRRSPFWGGGWVPLGQPSPSPALV